MKKKEEKKKEKQLDLGLRNTPANIFFKYKDRYDLWIAGLETRKFIKDVFTWFVFIFSATFITTEVYTIRTLTSIPSEIPIYTYFINQTDKLAPSDWIYIYPAIGALTLVIGLIFGNFFYHKEKNLSKTLLLTVLLTNFSLCIICLKLVNSF